MQIINKLSDIRIIGSIIEVHCIEQLDDGRIIGHWRTTLQKDSDLSVLEGHCTEEDVTKIQAHLSLLEGGGVFEAQKATSENTKG
jgi:hypothetical protein